MNFSTAVLRLSLVSLIAALSAVVAGCKTSQTEQTAIAPRLMQPVEFADFTVADISSREGAAHLMNQKIKIGSDAADAYDFLSKGETNRIHVETINQYEAAKAEGYFARNTFEITMESWFINTDLTLGFMAGAQPSQHSYFSKNIGLDLPPTVLGGFGERDDGLKADEENGVTLKDYTKSYGRRHIYNIRKSEVGVSFSCNDGCNYSVQELARGDVDRDGSEDALIVIATYAQGGSGRDYNPCIVTKTGPKQRVKFVEMGKHTEK